MDCSSGIPPPIRPRDYALPAGAVSVSTSAALSSVLAGATAPDIILEDGTCTTSGASDFEPAVGHRL